MHKVRYLQCASCCSDFICVQFWLFTFNNQLDWNPVSKKGLVGWPILSIKIVFQKESKPNCSSLSQTGILLYRNSICSCMIIRREICFSKKMKLSKFILVLVIVDMKFWTCLPAGKDLHLWGVLVIPSTCPITGRVCQVEVMHFIPFHIENCISLLPFLTLEGNDVGVELTPTCKLFWSVTNPWISLWLAKERAGALMASSWIVDENWWTRNYGKASWNLEFSLPTSPFISASHSPCWWTTLMDLCGSPEALCSERRKSFQGFPLASIGEQL